MWGTTNLSARGSVWPPCPGGSGPDSSTVPGSGKEWLLCFGALFWKPPCTIRPVGTTDGRSGRRYTAGSLSIVRPTLDEEDLSAPCSPPQEETRLPRSHANPCRAGHPRSSPGQGAHSSLGLRIAPTDVRTILRTGKSLAGARVILYVAPDAGGARAGFVVSRRVGGAVIRNRARRVMRAEWRAVQPAIGKGVAAVFVAPGPVRGARPQDGGTEA